LKRYKIELWVCSVISASTFLVKPGLQVCQRAGHGTLAQKSYKSAGFSRLKGFIERRRAVSSDGVDLDNALRLQFPLFAPNGGSNPTILTLALLSFFL
jgi:hypothetical protein